MLHAVELRIGWGKSVPLPAVPLYVPGLGTSAGALPAASTRPAFADLIVPIKPWETVGGEGEASVHTVGLQGVCEPVVQQPDCLCNPGYELGLLRIEVNIADVPVTEPSENTSCLNYLRTIQLGAMVCARTFGCLETVLILSV